MNKTFISRTMTFASNKWHFSCANSMYNGAVEFTIQIRFKTFNLTNTMYTNFRTFISSILQDIAFIPWVPSKQIILTASLIKARLAVYFKYECSDNDCISAGLIDCVTKKRFVNKIALPCPALLYFKKIIYSVNSCALPCIPILVHLYQVVCKI